MNEREVGMVLDMIRAHYWQTLKSEENDRALMLRTWAVALADVPLTPYTEKALERWFKEEKWPPQAAEVRERAKLIERADASVARMHELQALYSEGTQGTLVDPGVIHEWNQRRKAGQAEPAQEGA